MNTIILNTVNPNDKVLEPIKILTNNPIITASNVNNKYTPNFLKSTFAILPKTANSKNIQDVIKNTYTILVTL